MATSDTTRIGPGSLLEARSDLQFRMARVHRTLRRRWEEEIANLAVTAAQSEVLFLVGAEPGISQQKVAERLGTDAMNVKRMVAQLLERGLLRRYRGTGDRRVWHLELTGDGATVVQDLVKAAVRMRRSVSARLGPGQVRALTAAMDSLAAWAGGPPERADEQPAPIGE
ncbi:MarR family winged helix-turn-helix transcriptional regulator [Streptomyces caeni]|uniref:MarR family winged helix-turn-helix transcriptional regulator n=1 Tax=Streptomyces caeni TaxID=2307231 RepID=A0ABW4IXI5_9ACTN